MNQDFDDELERGAERRSRRNPKLKESVGELDILGDPSVHEVKTPVERRREETDQAGTAPRAAGSRSKASRPESRRSTRSRQSQGRRSTADQTAAAGGGDGISPRMAAQIARKKKRRRMIAMIVAECFALIFIFGYGFVARTMAKIQRPVDFVIDDIQTNDIDVATVETMKGYWTIAIFGVDSRDSAIQKNTNADVNMICNINLDTGEIKLVSVYRDSYLNISENGSYNKINQAYFLGGAQQSVAALNRNLDLKINDFVTFNWKSVAQAINILGGVDVELSKAEFYYINSFITETVKATGIGSHQLTRAGMNHLDGVQAVAYGRLRLMDTDYARTERQRKIIALAFEKAQKADFQTLYTMIGTVFPNVYTTLWVDDLVNNARNISKFHLGETTGFPNQRGDANLYQKGAVVVPATLESNVIRLHQFLFGDENYTPTDTVKSISAKIASDTGIYREGQVIDNVGTSGGVIQPPRTTAAATTSGEDDEEEGYQVIYETDADGNRVRRRVPLETDEDGEYIEIETDEDGYRVDDSTVSTRPTDPAETDEFGDVIEPESSVSRPGDPTESSATRPTSAGETSAARPGETSEQGTTTRPTTADRPTTSPTTSSSPTTVDRPGATTEPTTGSTNRPGATTEPTSGTVAYPGAVTEIPGTSSTNPTESGGPGSSTTSVEVPQFPGSTTSGSSSQPGAGDETVIAPSPVTSATVAAPGQ